MQRSHARSRLKHKSDMDPLHLHTQPGQRSSLAKPKCKPKKSIILIIVGSAAIALIISFVCYTFLLSGRNRRVSLRYSVVIDGGSSGTRVHVFGYRIESGNPVFDFSGDDGYASMKLSPGLSSYADDPEGASVSVAELVEFAKGRVPKRVLKESEIRLMATAGMRLLDVSVQERILQVTRRVLRSSGFKFRDDSALVISGSDEGGSTDRNQIYEINDYGQENAVLYSEQHDFPQDFGSVSSLAGGKGFNQDAAILHLGYGTEEGALCGVFDGHGEKGELVSKIIRNQLPSLLLGHMNNHSVTRDWKLICETTCLAMDKRILKLKNTIDCSSSGTAAVFAVKHGNQVMVANLGDSRAIMIGTSENGETEVVQLTSDLKPSVLSEADRIRKRNGRVLALEAEPHILRVWLPHENRPGLAMSRAFGDFVLKSYGVIATPEVSTHQITSRDQFLLLASDGVWDVLSNEEVAKVVMKSANETGAANAVTEAAANAWRQKYPTAKVDDISVVCLSINKRHVPQPRI